MGVSGNGGRIGPGVISAVVEIFSESSEFILSHSSRFVRIWLKTTAISTLFRSFLFPLRSSHNLERSIARRTAYHHLNGTAQQGELEFSHSRSFPRRKHKSAFKMVKLNELPPEIVDIIVHIGSSPQVRPESRYEDLNSFARIAPVFQYASQRVMNEQVVLSNGGLVMVWLEERKEEFVVKELKLHLPVDHDRTIAEENLVVRAIRACSSLLRTFEVGGWHRFDAAILAEANLKRQSMLLPFFILPQR